MKDVMGIVYTSRDNLNMRELTTHRAVAALPVAGRYRIIDFTLSNLVNSGVRNVGIIAQRNYQSLMDHVGSGKEWEFLEEWETSISAGAILRYIKVMSAPLSICCLIIGSKEVFMMQSLLVTSTYFCCERRR